MTNSPSDSVREEIARMAGEKLSEKPMTQDFVQVPREPTPEMLKVGTEARWQSAVRDSNNVREIYRAMIEAAPPAWECGARSQGTAGGNDPADCNWPVCGCDPYASKVIAALEECGALAAAPPAPGPGSHASHEAPPPRAALMVMSHQIRESPKSMARVRSALSVSDPEIQEAFASRVED